MKSKNFSAAVFLAAVVLICAGKSSACGPDFPNNLLDAGDQAVLQPPVADFQRELEQMKLVTAETRAVPLAVGQKFYEQSTELEMADLAAALKREKVSSEQAVVIMQAHLAERMKLNAFLKAQHEWEHFYAGYFFDTNGYHALPNTNPPPVFPAVAVTPGLPREFALYFQGAIAWQKHEGWLSCEAWEQLLALPPAERHFKSTWAAFMLGKCNESQTNDYADENALKFFGQVRAFVTNGFADSPGLAEVSLGEEARICLRQTNYGRAIELYLEQFAAGDSGAADSLRIAVTRALDETNVPSARLKTLVLNPRTRRVVSAYLISRNAGYGRGNEWLEAVEAAKVKDVECAGQLALAAYQSNEMEAAQRWIDRAGGEPVAQWLQAKLFMRAGKIDAAAKLLAKLSRHFPQELPGTNAATQFADSLYLNIRDYDPDRIAVGRQVLGELGVLRLARREYAESLDALLRSGYWQDAAYVAERVLTTDELKKYADLNWGATKSQNEIQFENNYDYRPGPIRPGERIRWLLARRLARENRFAGARGYFPAEWQPQLDAFTGKLDASRDEKLPGTQRALAMFAAARQMRTNGMELFGTELQPDWFVEGGNFEMGVTWEDRATNSADTKINLASTNEIARAAAHGVEPEERWHYRDRAERMIYQAADLAWDAAKSMPDNADETARFLCTAGTWLKKRDPQAADRFYKALVLRCPQTAIGKLADKIRWFPLLDDYGNLKPWPPPRKVYGGKYVVRYGDTLVNIALDAGIAPQAVRDANPGLNPVRLKIGQVLVIPEASGTNAASERPAAPN